MIGEKLLNKPETLGDCEDILKMFGIKEEITLFLKMNVYCNLAERLVELNNEVYKTLHSKRFIENRLNELQRQEYIDSQRATYYSQMNK